MLHKGVLLGEGLVFVVLLTFAVQAFGQPPGAVESQSAHEPGDPEEARESEHKPRHGGYFGDADDLYHYEVLLTPSNRLILYVNDEHNTPLDVRPLTGRWTLNPDVPSPVTESLIPSEDGAYFFAMLPPSESDPLHVKVAVLRGDVWAEMEFYLPHPQGS